MFGSKKAKSSKSNSTKGKRGVETLIAQNTELEGKVRFTGILTIEGSIVGDVLSMEETDSVVYITVDGKVKGEVRSPDVIINGHVEGDVYATGQLVLASNAVVDGNVHYNLIEMEKGASINGNMDHIHPDTPLISPASTGKISKASGSKGSYKSSKSREPIEQAELSTS